MIMKKSIFFIVFVCNILFSVTMLTAQNIDVAEPEFVNTGIYVENNQPYKLEKAVPYTKSGRTAASFITGFHASKDKKMIKGVSSPLRIPVKNSYTFIVRVLSNDYAPQDEVMIIKLDKSRDKRNYVAASYDMLGQYKEGEVTTVPYEAEKYGASSYLIRVNQTIPAGEYAIVLRRASDVLNCFGVGELGTQSGTARSDVPGNNRTREKNRSVTQNNSVPVNQESSSTQTRRTNKPGRHATESTDKSAFQAMVTGDVSVYGGLGVGSPLYGGVPLVIGGDYMINDVIGIGAEFNRMSYNESLYSYDLDWTVTLFGARGTYHVMETLDLSNPKLDLYGGLFLGVASVSVDADDGVSSDSYSSPSDFGYTFFVGGRYMFSENVGLNGELGYGISVLKLGLNVRL